MERRCNSDYFCSIQMHGTGSTKDEIDHHLQNNCAPNYALVLLSEETDSNDIMLPPVMTVKSRIYSPCPAHCIERDEHLLIG